MLISDLKTYFQKRFGNQDCLAEKIVSSWEQPKPLCRGSGFKVHENLADGSLCLSSRVISHLEQEPYTPVYHQSNLQGLSQQHLSLPYFGLTLAAVDLHPLGNSSILESGSENISRWLFLCCYSSADEKEADLATSLSTNMCIGAHIPQQNTKLSGNLACCDLFKMWADVTLRSLSLTSRGLMPMAGLWHWWPLVSLFLALALVP